MICVGRCNCQNLMWLMLKPIVVLIKSYHVVINVMSLGAKGLQS